MKYEYRKLRADKLMSADQLNKDLGSKRWELVTIPPFKEDNMIVHYFKREILDDIGKKAK